MNKLPRPVFWTSLLVAVLLAGVLAACSSAPKADQAQVPQDSCGPIEPTDADIKKVLSFGEGVFNSADWVKSYTVAPYKVTLTRHNDAVQAIVYSEYLIFTCGYSQTDLGNYFNDEGFNIIFSDYESHTLAKFCEQSGTSLYEYDLVDSDNNYKARYWVKQEDEKHIFVYMLVFPQSNPDMLNTFSKQLFPLLTACP